MLSLESVERNVVEAYKSQLLIVMADMLGGEIEIDLKRVDEFPIGKGLSVMIKDLKPAPDLGEGRFTGTFVLKLVDVEVQDRPIMVDTRVIGEA